MVHRTAYVPARAHAPAADTGAGLLPAPPPSLPPIASAPRKSMPRNRQDDSAEQARGASEQAGERAAGGAGGAE
eukprot:CAMPEP_0202735458 /NCGR_PEP_ID=MMETSP1388-20130828/405_1 /ASSEMBLY_ACC=CAM_ASM_000864 /TAXON_ID=37098 /ORGANISM="Isochrysis sp, Strain CCMP1244" /LENGTH=73 /DNA_ID=CAMNT_0049401893 /DNA_START=185 /DNA_END=404 /DNA_ORIENTATION=+